MGMTSLLSSIARPFGYRVVRDHRRRLRFSRDLTPGLVYLHKYAGGEEEYREAQIFHNKRKLQNVWADEATLEALAKHLTADGRRIERGICHGARNGYEVGFLRDRLQADVIGTDISETATQFPHMVVWDFHKDNPEWRDRFDFVYTNSLDQALRPDQALAAWARQIKPEGGRIYIEHTMAHAADHASAMDPFGAHPMCMPYLFFIWGKGQYRLTDILELGAKANNGMEVWLFVLERDSAR